jgi:hypothetical protein
MPHISVSILGSDMTHEGVARRYPHASVPPIAPRGVQQALRPVQVFPRHASVLLVRERERQRQRQRQRQILLIGACRHYVPFRRDVSDLEVQLER